MKELSFWDMVLRLALSMLCGGVIGYGRSRKQRPAGLRTYMLVCLGAASAVLISLYLYEILQGQWAAVVKESGAKVDPARIAAQTIAGIGFLGAGIIIKVSHSQVSGLTTAAGLWATGIVGLAIGAGYFELGLIGMILILLAETVFNSIGRMIHHTPEYTVEVYYNEKKQPGPGAAVLQGQPDDDREPEDPYAGRERAVAVCCGG